MSLVILIATCILTKTDKVLYSLNDSLVLLILLKIVFFNFSFPDIAVMLNKIGFASSIAYILMTEPYIFDNTEVINLNMQLFYGPCIIVSQIYTLYLVLWTFTKLNTVNHE